MQDTQNTRPTQNTQCKSDYSYKCVGFHLDVVLREINKNIAKNIDEHVLPKLPKIHKGTECDKVFEMSAGPGKTCDDEEGEECMKLMQTLCMCVKHRKTHMKVWIDFVNRVVKQIIPNAVKSRVEHIQNNKRIREMYKPGLIGLITQFANTLQRHFMDLQDIETARHQPPIQRMIQYRLNTLRKKSSASSGSNDCVVLLSKTPNKIVDQYARQLGIPKVHKTGRLKLSHKICSKIVEC